MVGSSQIPRFVPASLPPCLSTDLFTYLVHVRVGLHDDVLLDVIDRLDRARGDCHAETDLKVQIRIVRGRFVSWSVLVQK